MRLIDEVSYEAIAVVLCLLRSMTYYFNLLTYNFESLSHCGELVQGSPVQVRTRYLPHLDDARL